MTASTARLRLDRSRPFAQIRGQRSPGDPHQLVHFQQDGIHFDSQGLHLDHLIGTDELRSLVEKRLKRQAKSAPKKADAGEGDNGDPEDDASGSPGGDDVNIDAWLRGEAKYPWFAITKTVRERYKSNKTTQVDVVDFLVNEQKIVPISDLAPELAKLLNPA